MKKLLVLVLAAMLLMPSLSAEARTKFARRVYRHNATATAGAAFNAANSGAVVSENRFINKDDSENCAYTITCTNAAATSPGQTFVIDQSGNANTCNLTPATIMCNQTTRAGVAVFDGSIDPTTVTGTLRVIAVDSTDATALVRVMAQVRGINRTIGANTRNVNVPLNAFLHVR